MKVAWVGVEKGRVISLNERFNDFKERHPVNASQFTKWLKDKLRDERLPDSKLELKIDGTDISLRPDTQICAALVAMDV